MQHGPEFIRDPVHGFVELCEPELELVDSSPFRRLARIRQLALTSHVFPGAEHTRFQHSLGVLHLASMVFDHLGREADLADQLRRYGANADYWRRVLRCAALLHDVGHPPFSHSGEDLLPLDKDDSPKAHEDISRELVEAGEISAILERADIDAGHVADVLSKTPLDTPILLHQILDGDLDVDRTDYLMRDSLFTGVKYGVFDHERLIRCLVVCTDPIVEQPVLALHERGLHASEGLILARYSMFTQVYFNKVRRAYDLLLRDFLGDELPDGRYPASIDEYLKWDDTRVWQLALAKQDDSPAAASLVKREHWPVAWETTDHPDETVVRTFEPTVEEFRRRHPEIDVREDKAEAAPHKFGASDFWVVTDDGNLEVVLRQSKVIDALEPINKYRVYAPPEHRDTVRGFLRERLRRG